MWKRGKVLGSEQQVESLSCGVWERSSKISEELLCSIRMESSSEKKGRTNHE